VGIEPEKDHIAQQNGALTVNQPPIGPLRQTQQQQSKSLATMLTTILDKIKLKDPI
jgi:hypothetical protein